MDRYIGLDAHAARCTLAVTSQMGRRLTDFPIETNGQARVEAAGTPRTKIGRVSRETRTSSPLSCLR